MRLGPYTSLVVERCRGLTLSPLPAVEGGRVQAARTSHVDGWSSRTLSPSLILRLESRPQLLTHQCARRLRIFLDRRRACCGSRGRSMRLPASTDSPMRDLSDIDDQHVNELSITRVGDTHRWPCRVRARRERRFPSAIPAESLSAAPFPPHGVGRCLTPPGPQRGIS